MTGKGSGPLTLLGGTFDPPHIGHLVLAECAWEQFGGVVLFVPAGEPWRKADEEVTPAHHRLAMTELAVETNSRFAVDGREIQREGPTYTVDTLEELRAEGHDEIVLVLGGDALADLPNWREPQRIRQLARLAVAERPGSHLPEVPGVIAVEMPAIEISSTEIRERAAAGKTIRYLVPDAVRDYIGFHGLYRTR